jgi:hypothetical protein
MADSDGRGLRGREAAAGIAFDLDLSMVANQRAACSWIRQIGGRPELIIRPPASEIMIAHGSNILVS